MSKLIVVGGMKVAEEDSIDAVVDGYVLATGGVAYNIVEIRGGELAEVEFIVKTSSLIFPL
jgi:hypothetical protein